jgi:beta-carotene ketolase (CrtW type)
LPPRAIRQAVGLALAVAIAGSWLGIDAWGMFGFELSGNNLPLALGLAGVQCWLSVGVFILCPDAMRGTLVPGRRRRNAAIGAVLLALYAGFACKRLRDAHFAPTGWRAALAIRIF